MILANYSEPSIIKIGLFYGGQKISIKANVPDGYEVITKIKGPDETLHLKKKGKVWGILWMNVKEISYNFVPKLYIIRSSSKIASIAPINILQPLEIGYESLKEKTTNEQEPETKELFGELIKLKESEGLFSINNESFKCTSLQNGMRQAVTEFMLPPKAPVGEYIVELFAFSNGSGSRIETSTFKLEQAPSINFLSSLAFNHGFLFGCLAVIIAILAGLLSGIIFGGSGKGH
ncbi:MAG: TIGR02186 family protein [Desulfobacterales bacterium]|nr:TIGR02186 family protein [Desulfobacterales bacterium]